MNRRHFLRAGRLVLATLLTCLGTGAFAGEFTINPLRVTLDRTARSSEVVVRNEDTAVMRMQVQAMEWTQGADGADRYQPTDALVYFPRTMEIPPGESRIVRVGVRGAPATREDAYRLFIEELPPPPGSEPDGGGAQLRIYLRVGVAVFVAPPQPERKAEITRLAVSGRRVDWEVRNLGNVSVRADEIELRGLGADGRRLFTYQVPERYFLAGVTRPMQFEVPAAACAGLVAIEATVVADRVDLRRKIDVAAGTCN